MSVMAPVVLALANGLMIWVAAHGIFHRRSWARSACLLAVAGCVTLVIWDVIVDLWIAAIVWAIVTGAMLVAYRHLTGPCHTKEQEHD